MKDFSREAITEFNTTLSDVSSPQHRDASPHCLRAYEMMSLPLLLHIWRVHVGKVICWIASTAFMQGRKAVQRTAEKLDVEGARDLAGRYLEGWDSAHACRDPPRSPDVEPLLSLVPTPATRRFPALCRPLRSQNSAGRLLRVLRYGLDCTITLPTRRVTSAAGMRAFQILRCRRHLMLCCALPALSASEGLPVL